MATPTNEERVVESVDRAWVLDGPDHPLARLTADEIRTARQIMVDADLVSETTLFPILSLDEPPKNDVHRAGSRVPYQATRSYTTTTRRTPPSISHGRQAASAAMPPRLHGLKCSDLTASRMTEWPEVPYSVTNLRGCPTNQDRLYYRPDHLGGGT
jgi:hypothetical protein